ncbi:MAG: sulfatase [Bacteroidota bacterium]
MKGMLCLSAGIAFLLGCSGEKKKVEEGTKVPEMPNIVWIVAEDQSPERFPMYGDSTISLPNLESLAQDGVTFTNAVSPVPVCAPARSALITGMYPTTLGTHNMRTHAGWRKINEPLLDSLISYSPVVPDGVRMFPEYLRQKGYYTANGPKEDYNFEKTDAAWDESSPRRHWRKRKEGQPFFTVFNFAVCHESGIWRYNDSTLYVSPDKVWVPPYFPDTPVIRHDLAVNYSNLKRMDDQVGEVLRELKEDGLYENSIVFFYGDHGGPFPRHKRALYDSGLKVPLVIKFPENRNAGSTDDRLISFIDYAPTVLSLAGIEPPKVMQGTAHFGYYEASQRPKYTFHSSDRFDELYDRLRAVRNDRFKYIKSFNTELPHAIPVSYREQMPLMQELRKLYKSGKLNEVQAHWLTAPKPEEELYDLINDPFEINNLANDPQFKDTLMHFRKVFQDWMQESKDLGAVPERELMANWLIDEEQPTLGPLEMVERNDSVRLVSKRRDASIVWKKPQDSIWNVYSGPLPKDISFEAKAERIGFTDSAILEYKAN